MGALEEYYKIINFRLENPLQKGTYGEKHHIKPKSIYPELAREKSNIVKLLPEEHYKCHALLPDIYKELKNKDAYKKMLFAWHFMAVDGKHTIDEQAKEYAKLREEYRKVDSEALSGENAPWYGKRGKDNPRYGKHLSEETREKISEARLGKPSNFKGKKLSKEAKEKLSKALSGENNPWYGKHLSEETRKKISEANLGKPKSEEHKKKLSEAKLGKNHPRYGKCGKDSPNYGKKYKHSEEYYLKHPDKRK